MSEIKKREASQPQEMEVLSEAIVKESIHQWKLYRELEQGVLSEEDFMFFVERENTRPVGFAHKKEAMEFQKKYGGHLVKRKKKSGFRKLATFLQLTLPEPPENPDENYSETERMGDYIHEVKKWGNVASFDNWYDGKNLKLIKSRVEVMVMLRTSKGTRQMLGVGGADINERGWAKEQDIITTAFTRALNRAISDMIGFGEVSAEEIDAQYVSNGPPIIEVEPMHSKSEENKDLEELKELLEKHSAEKNAVTSEKVLNFIEKVKKGVSDGTLTNEQIKQALQYLKSILLKPQEDSNKITVAQRKKIFALKTELKVATDVFESLICNYGVESINDLTKEQASELIKTLESQKPLEEVDDEI